MSVSSENPSRMIQVGRVAGGFGVRGEVRITTFTENPLALKTYRDLKGADGAPALTVKTARAVNGGIIARVAEVETKEQADALRGLSLFVARDSLPAPEEDEFYLADLIGLDARTPEGVSLGRIKAVHDFGAGDIIEIDPGGGKATWYLPFTREAVPEVKVTEGFVTVVRPGEVSADPQTDRDTESPSE
jgi:16S rRNA processing protein RimM